MTKHKTPVNLTVLMTHNINDNFFNQVFDLKKNCKNAYSYNNDWAAECPGGIENARHSIFLHLAIE